VRLLRWHILSLSASLCFGVWALVPKAASPLLTAGTMQLLSMLGMIPAAGLLLLSRNALSGLNAPRGVFHAVATGVLGNCGNLAMLEALKRGGSAAIVYPLCGMFPLVTIVLARVWLQERLNLAQKMGCVLSLIAIYILSTGTDASSAAPASNVGVEKSVAPLVSAASSDRVLPAT